MLKLKPDTVTAEVNAAVVLVFEAVEEVVPPTLLLTVATIEKFLLKFPNGLPEGGFISTINEFVTVPCVVPATVHVAADKAFAVVHVALIVTTPVAGATVAVALVIVTVVAAGCAGELLDLVSELRTVALD